MLLLLRITNVSNDELSGVNGHKEMENWIINFSSSLCGLHCKIVTSVFIETHAKSFFGISKWLKLCLKIKYFSAALKTN